MNFNAWNVFWRWCFGTLTTLIVSGNTLTVWIFHEQRHRKRASYLLISLSVADLLVGLLSIPLLIASYETSSVTVLKVFFLVDVFTALASIYTLGVISLERMFAVVWPHRHRTMRLRAYICAIATPWVIAAIIAFLLFTLKKLLIGLLIFCPAAPLLVMCRAYYVIWKNQRSAVGIQNHVGLREARLTKTLFLITGASIFAWLPFQILSVLTYLGVTTSFPYLQLTTLIVRVLQFSNSLINVAIYPFRIPEFKNTLWQILCCHRDFHSLIHPLAGSGWSVRSLLRLPTLVFPSENLTQESPV